MSNDFAHLSSELGITLRPRTTYSPWTNGKVEVQNKHLTQYFRHFLSTSGSNWSELTNKFAFAHNTAINSSTGYTPYEIVFGIKPQVPLSLKLGLYRDQNKKCTSEFCAGLENHAHTEHKSNNETIDRFLKNQISAEILKSENDFKLIYSNTYTHCRRITNKAHMFRNQFKLGRPIKEGTKVLLENRSKPLLKSQKLLNLRSGPYTVIEKITEVTYGIQNDFTNEKKLSTAIILLNTFLKNNKCPSYYKSTLVIYFQVIFMIL